ncbi:MAG: prephenate dehydrogenase [Lachnospiraceae bacterium]|nr:prephenate dehydrogenase [Lachnospiraceae bacterium]
MNKSRVVIVGLGLIGGSYAKALKRMGYTISAIDKDPETIKYAVENNIIDDGLTENYGELLEKADCIIIALYPGLITDWIKENQRFFKPGIRITDVTGVKSSFIYEVQDILREDVEFIAAHPMAGREVCGVKNSDDRIFRNANYIVVPTKKNTDAAIVWCEHLGKILGFDRVSVLTPEEHDEMIAFVSQLTHCIAVSLMTCNNDTHLKDYTGDSFRDLTRIARINENMWSELFLVNKEPLLRQMNSFINELEEMKHMLETDDAEGLKEKMRRSTNRRIQFDKEQ